MPRIGLRIIKSAIAVFLCFSISIFRGAGIPFYSAIAAILCMQPELTDSYEKGRSRIIATFIGGFCGMVILYLLQAYIPQDALWLRYSIISLLIIPILYVTVLMKQPSSAYLSCVVFMSITVSHGQDEAVMLFAFNRMLDTLIGIVVAWGVNAFHLPSYKNKEVLIEIPLASLLNEKGCLDTHTRVHLNRCIDQGAHILLSSPHTPSGLLQRIQGVHMPITCLLMDGCLEYDPQSQTCRALQTLTPTTWQPLYQELIANEIWPFLYEVKDEMLYVHGELFINQYLKEIYEKSRKETGKHYVMHEVSLTKVLHHEMIAMMIAGDIEVMEKMKDILCKHQEEITWVIHPIEQQKEIYLLRIYPITLAKQDVLQDVLMKQYQLKDTMKIRLATSNESSKQAIRLLEKAFHMRNFQN